MSRISGNNFPWCEAPFFESRLGSFRDASHFIFMAMELTDRQEIASQGIANPPVPFLNGDSRVFFTRQYQHCAGVFLSASLRAFDGVFRDENHGAIMRGKAIIVGFDCRWKKCSKGIAAFVTVARSWRANVGRDGLCRHFVHSQSMCSSPCLGNFNFHNVA